MPEAIFLDKLSTWTFQQIVIEVNNKRLSKRGVANRWSIDYKHVNVASFGVKCPAEI